MNPFAVGFLMSNDVHEEHADTELPNSSVKMAVMRVGTVMSCQAHLPVKRCR